jgi:hypothetical protein
LAQLEKWAGNDGAGAVTEATHFALTVWLMNSPHSMGKECSAVLSRWEHLRAQHRTPNVRGRRWRSPLACMATADRQAIEAAAADLLAQWEAAGSPGLGRAIERTQQIIHSARIAAEDRRIAREAIDHLFQENA